MLWDYVQVQCIKIGVDCNYGLTDVRPHASLIGHHKLLAGHCVHA